MTDADIFSPSLAETCSNPTTYKPSKSIRFCTIDDRVVIMDLNNGKYLVFDQVASFMWSLILSKKAPSLWVEQIVSKFEVTPFQCTIELNEFIDTCKVRAFICEGDLETSISEEYTEIYGVPNIIYAGKCIFHTRRELKMFGFSWVYDRHLRSRCLKGPHSVIPSLSKALRIFSLAENLYSVTGSKIDCLPRSLSLHRYLLSIGIAANHCIGVRRFPFVAHAWVEVESRIIFDSESFVEQFVEISRI